MRAGRAGCEGCASYDADLEAATKDLVDAERRAAALEKALRKHGTHGVTRVPLGEGVSTFRICPAHPTMAQEPGPCDCGLDAALAGEEVG